MIKYLGISIGIFIALIVLYFVINAVRDKNACKVYNSNIKDFYNQGDDIISCLEKVSAMFKPNTIYFLAITKAVFYLRHSIMMDFESAFKIIEKAFKTQEVKNTNNVLLNSENDKLLLLLEKKE